MIDKVQKIKDWISKEQEGLMDAKGNFEYPEHEGAYHILCNLDAYIDSLQEEPVSENLQKAAEQDVCEVVNCCSATRIPNDHIPSWVQDAMVNEFIHGAKWQKAKDESTTEDLGEYINELSKQFPEVSFAKLSRIAVRVAKWQKEKEYTCYEEAFEDGAKWKVENLWKPADGDDLPEIDREVVAILDYDFGHYKVVYAHRPNPNGWDGTNIDTGEKEHFEPATYGKGGWNQTHILYWLDARLPYEENKIIK